MPNKYHNLSKFFIIGLACCIFLTMIIFETAQQMFYITTFQLDDDAMFLDLLITQSRKWLIWIIFATPLWIFIKSQTDNNQITAKQICKITFLIVVLLFLVIFTMSVIEIVMTEDVASQEIWREYFTFYVFQKIPVYSFGYTFLSILFYLYFKNHQLTVQVLKLSQLNQTDLKQLNQQKLDQEVNTSVLKIKVGHKHKIIPIENISWIEADDYCANIHNIKNDSVYSMRTTLKSLEQLLPMQFIRVHRSAIVNMNCVNEYKTQGGGLIKMQNGDEVTVAQSKIKQVNDYFSLN